MNASTSDVESGGESPSLSDSTDGLAVNNVITGQTIIASPSNNSAVLQLFSLAQLRTMFVGVPFFTKWLLLFIVVLSIAAVVFPAIPTVFGLVPGFTLSTPYYFWNVCTAGFFEDSLLKLLGSSVLLLIYGKHLESMWGTYEFAKFVVITNLSVGLTTCFLIVIVYGVTGDETLIYSRHWCGFSGALVGFTVAVKQLNPDIELSIIPLRAKQIPGLVVSILVILGGLGVLSGLQYIPFPALGLFYSWIYLRFFQVRTSGPKGDYSEAFSFATFFPELLQPYVSLLFNLIFNVLRLCCPCFRSSETQRQVHTFIDPSAVSLADPADAERRRQRALRALDTRIAQIKEGEVKPTLNAEAANQEGQT